MLLENQREEFLDAMKAHRELEMTESDLEMTESGLSLLSGACLKKTLNILRLKIINKSSESVLCRAYEVGNIIQMTSDGKMDLCERLDDAFLKNKDIGSLKFQKFTFCL